MLLQKKGKPELEEKKKSAGSIKKKCRYESGVQY